MSKEIDFGPLEKLIGTWEGDKGLDIAPEPEGKEENPYFETIKYIRVGDVTNAKSQVLAVIRYHQVVSRKSDNEVFHDETGYWMWDAQTSTVMHSLVIPRGVALLAGGIYKEKSDNNKDVIIQVKADIDNKDWQIIQSPFMANKAKTISFVQTITLGNGKMNYVETTMLEIYGKSFEHTDQNELFLQN